VKTCLGRTFTGRCASYSDPRRGPDRALVLLGISPWQTVCLAYGHLAAASHGARLDALPSRRSLRSLNRRSARLGVGQEGHALQRLRCPVRGSGATAVTCLQGDGLDHAPAPTFGKSGLLSRQSLWARIARRSWTYGSRQCLFPMFWQLRYAPCGATRNQVSAAPRQRKTTRPLRRADAHEPSGKFAWTLQTLSCARSTRARFARLDISATPP
jgi:hypothetical protein